MRRFILVALRAALCAATASAQQSDDEDYPKAEGYVGFSHFRATGGGTVGFNGFEAAVTANVSRLVGLKFDLFGRTVSRTRFRDEVQRHTDRARGAPAPEVERGGRNPAHRDRL